MINFDKGDNMQFGTETGMQFTQPVESAETWNQFRANYKRNAFIPNGISGDDLSPTINQVDMSFVSGQQITISDNEQIYTCSSSELAAISLDGSSKNWSQTPTAGEDFENSTPGLVGDVLFMVESTDSSDIRRFVIYDKLTGDEIDSRLVDVVNQPFDDNYIIQNQLLYQKNVVSGIVSEYFAYDTSTLTQTELFSHGETTYNSIVHSDDNIFAIDTIGDGGAIVKFDFSGNVINSISAGDISTAAISPDNNLLIASSDIAALSTDSLTQEWTSDLPGIIAIDNDIICGTLGSTLFKLDLSDGTLIDSVDTNINTLNRIAITSDTIYVSSSDDLTLAAFDKNNLSEIFQLTLGPNPFCITESSVVMTNSEVNAVLVIT